MKQIIFHLGLLMIITISCEKNKTGLENYPEDVTFSYYDSLVTYGVIKKEYYYDGNGDLLERPIVKLWLDRNLGAKRVAVSRTDSLSFGDLFQWGRSADGHQMRFSDTTYTLAKDKIPNHHKFILTSWSENYIHKFSNDWLETSNDSLWNDDNNSNCPCPEGWRLPTIEELKMEMMSWDSIENYGAFNNELHWVANGYREIGVGRIMYDQWWLCLWSSTFIEDGNALGLTVVGRQDTFIAKSNRSYGRGVRCVKDY